MSAAPTNPGGGPLLLFGGTFDPPHCAHAALATAAADLLGAGRILFIPAARNPLKFERPAGSDEHRLAMLRLAFEHVAGAEVCTLELDRGGPSYFVHTLRALEPDIKAAGSARFLIGVDQAMHFHSWKDWRQILQRATPAVLLRSPWDRASYQKALRDHFDAAEARQWQQWTLELPLMDVSATEIRRRLVAGESMDGLLDPRVEAYVREHGLYGA